MFFDVKVLKGTWVLRIVRLREKNRKTGKSPKVSHTFINLCDERERQEPTRSCDSSHLKRLRARGLRCAVLVLVLDNSVSLLIC